MKLNNNQHAFFVLVRAGLWEKDVQLSQFEPIDFKEIYRLAQEQSVVGLIAAGLEHVIDVKAPKDVVLTYVGEALQLEHRNAAMNLFIGELVNKMRQANIYTLLVKGQGVAQCYERPLWRACGDVDFFLSDDNYVKAKEYLLPLSKTVDNENEKRKHFSMTIEPWTVELHGSMRSSLWLSLDIAIDKIQRDIFCGGNVRTWMNGETQVFLPAPNEDVVLVFSHILQHFFREGIGLRQICDWCRLLWTYKNHINNQLLYQRLRSMGAMSEWKAFASLAVNYLGMPVDAMPLYNSSRKWSRKAKKILAFIFETGNLGHNRDYSYYNKYPYLLYKVISFCRHSKDSFRYFSVFPWDSVKVWWGMIKEGFRYVMRGK